MKNKILGKLMSIPRVRSLGLKEDAIKDIIKCYDDLVVDSLLESGCIELDNGMIIEVVQLLDRVHVLRGVSYRSSRKYKLKLTMGENLYKKIEEYYERLKKEII